MLQVDKSLVKTLHEEALADLKWKNLTFNDARQGEKKSHRFEVQRQRLDQDELSPPRDTNYSQLSDMEMQNIKA